MSHLPGFWDTHQWTEHQWEEYRRRRRGWRRVQNRFDQLGHFWMGRFRSRTWWENREAKQWPSKTGSFDPCEDEYHWLLGAGHQSEAETLLVAARRRRPEFLKGRYGPTVGA